MPLVMKAFFGSIIRYLAMSYRHLLLLCRFYADAAMLDDYFLITFFAIGARYFCVTRECCCERYAAAAFFASLCRFLRCYRRQYFRAAHAAYTLLYVSFSRALCASSVVRKDSYDMLQRKSCAAARSASDIIIEGFRLPDISMIHVYHVIY